MIDQIENFLRKEINHGLKEVAIFREIDGSYNLFSRYIIKKVKSNIIVEILNTSQRVSFNTLKNAVTYCIFDKRNKFYERQRIHDLDQKLVGLEVEINIENRLFKKTKAVDIKLIHLAKLNENKIKKKKYEHELNQYVSDAKSWQDKRFKQNDKYKY